MLKVASIHELGGIALSDPMKPITRAKCLASGMRTGFHSPPLGILWKEIACTIVLSPAQCVCFVRNNNYNNKGGIFSVVIVFLLIFPLIAEPNPAKKCG